MSTLGGRSSRPPQNAQDLLCRDRANPLCNRVADQDYIICIQPSFRHLFYNRGMNGEDS